MNGILDLTALELGAAIRAGEVTVAEAARAALFVAEGGCGNAFITLDTDRAMARAEQLQKQVREG